MEENVKKKTFKDTLGVITGQPWFSGLVPLFIIMTVASIVSPAFLTQDNLIDMARTASYSFCVAAPFTFLMTTGGIDLSMGAMTSLGGVVCGKALLTGMGIVPALLCAVLVGCLVGIVKSLLIVDLGLPGFIATLGLQYIINGAILVWTEGINVTGLPLEFKALGQGSLIPGTRFYNTIAIAIVIAVVFWFLLEKTKFGRCVCAVGGNQETARIAGIRTRVYIYTCHMMVSAFAGIAGSLYTSLLHFTSTIVLCPVMHTLANGCCLPSILL